MDLIELPGQPFTRHPWEVARAQFFCDILAGSGVLAATTRVLDVGSGDGFLSRALATRMRPGSHITCFDVNYSDAFLADQPGDDVGGVDVTFSRKRPEDRFDLLLFLDVIEHVADDHGFLSDLVECNLRGCGHVLISVPAYMALFTQHDLRLGHYRRYTAPGLRRLTAEVALEWVKGGGVFHGLLLCRAAQKVGERARGLRSAPDPTARIAGETDTATWKAGSALTTLVNGALRVDNLVSRLAARVRVALPGLSTWVLARKA